MQNCKVCKKEIKTGDYEISWGKTDRLEEFGLVASKADLFYLCKKDFKVFKKRNGIRK